MHMRQVTKSCALTYITILILSCAAIQWGLDFVLAFICLRTVCGVCEEQVLFCSRTAVSEPMLLAYAVK